MSAFGCAAVIAPLTDGPRDAPPRDVASRDVGPRNVAPAADATAADESLTVAREAVAPGFATGAALSTLGTATDESIAATALRAAGEYFRATTVVTPTINTIAAAARNTTGLFQNFFTTTIFVRSD